MEDSVLTISRFLHFSSNILLVCARVANGSLLEYSIFLVFMHDGHGCFQISNHQFLIWVWYMEIYNEDINDLLAVESQRLQFHEHVEVLNFIMGCLGNKGCIAVSLQLYKTSFCFICSHLASGEREGDERCRKSDVTEILKNTSFPRICRTSFTRVPHRITKHEIALSYSETKTLLEKNSWDTLLNKDQIERDTGRVFKGWHEGEIMCNVKKKIMTIEPYRFFLNAYMC